MMWGYDAGWGWLWMAAMMVVFWGGVVTLIVFAIRTFAPGKGSDAAVEILRKRLAGGEINQEEFDRTLKALHG